MTLSEGFKMEMLQEAVATRKILALVPMDKADWKPHSKSMTLKALAVHVAEISDWYSVVLLQDELDFATMEYNPFIPSTTDELLAFFDANVEKSEGILDEFPDERMHENWTMRQGEMIFFTLPKIQVVRTWCMNHLYHHRAQLGLYLRMLDIPLPGVYGPSADSQ